MFCYLAISYVIFFYKKETQKYCSAKLIFRSMLVLDSIRPNWKDLGSGVPSLSWLIGHSHYSICFFHFCRLSTYLTKLQIVLFLISNKYG